MALTAGDITRSLGTALARDYFPRQPSTPTIGSARFNPSFRGNKDAEFNNYSQGLPNQLDHLSDSFSLENTGTLKRKKAHYDIDPLAGQLGQGATQPYAPQRRDISFPNQPFGNNGFNQPQRNNEFGRPYLQGSSNQGVSTIFNQDQLKTITNAIGPYARQPDLAPRQTIPNNYDYSFLANSSNINWLNNMRPVELKTEFINQNACKQAAAMVYSWLSGMVEQRPSMSLPIAPYSLQPNTTPNSGIQNYLVPFIASPDQTTTSLFALVNNALEATVQRRSITEEAQANSFDQQHYNEVMNELNRLLNKNSGSKKQNAATTPEAEEEDNQQHGPLMKETFNLPATRQFIQQYAPTKISQIYSLRHSYEPEKDSYVTVKGQMKPLFADISLDTLNEDSEFKKGGVSQIKHNNQVNIADKPTSIQKSNKRSFKPIVSNEAIHPVAKNQPVNSNKLFFDRKSIFNLTSDVSNLLPSVGPSYSMDPPVSLLAHYLTSHLELAQVFSVTISNQYGSIHFLDPLDLRSKNIDRCVSIQRDSVEILDPDWTNKRIEVKLCHYMNYRQLEDWQQDYVCQHYQEVLQRMQMNNSHFNQVDGILTARNF